MDNALLFNGCTNHEAPDWSQFSTLELGGCINCDDDDGYVVGGIGRTNAEFFTVYGRFKDGPCEVITDLHTFDEGVTVGEHLATLSGLSLTIVC
jgi:hypothetical protein